MFLYYRTRSNYSNVLNIRMANFIYSSLIRQTLCCSNLHSLSIIIKPNDTYSHARDPECARRESAEAPRVGDERAECGDMERRGSRVGAESGDSEGAEGSEIRR